MALWTRPPDHSGFTAPAAALTAYDPPTDTEMLAAHTTTDAAIAAVKAETALIVADTNELQTDDYPTSIAAIKAETALIVEDTNELQTDDYPTSIAAIKAETALIVGDTNELQTDDVPGLIAALPTAAGISDAVWDETTAGHTDAGSTGLAVGSLYSTIVVRVGQCGDAGGATTIDLDAGASAVNDFYKGQLIAIPLGTGAGQARTCTSYAGDTKIATITPAWATNPDGDSYFAVLNTGSTVVVDWVDGGRLDLIIDAIKAETALIVADTGTDGVLLANDAISAAKIADNAFSEEHFDDDIDGFNLYEGIRILGAKSAGKRTRTVDGANWDIFYYALDDLTGVGTAVIEQQDVDVDGQVTGTITITP